MTNLSPQYLGAQITKFIFIFILFLVPINVNSEVNLTEILDGNSKKITNEINNLKKEMNVLSKNKDLILSHENEKLRVKLLAIKQKLKRLKQDPNMQIDKNSQTNEIYYYAIDILNTLVCEKYLLGDFSDLNLSEFKVKC